MVRVRLSPEGGPELQVAAHALRAGGVAIVPTDTLYGFSARYDRPSAVRRIAAIKGRGEGDPFLVLIADPAQLALLTGDPPPAPVLDRVWPGPVTILVRSLSKLPPGFSGPAGTVAVRCPRDPLVRDLVALVGVPVISTSVNRHGALPLGDPETIARNFGMAIDVLVDAGPRENRQPSTIVDLTREPPVVVREGAAAVDIDAIGRIMRGRHP